MKEWLAISLAQDPAKLAGGKYPTHQHSSLSVAILFAASVLLVGCDGTVQESHPTQSKPMERICDSYIDVRWISVDRSIGATTYDFVDNAGSTHHTRALVLLGGDRPKMDYQMNLVKLPYNENGPSEEVDARSPFGEEVIRSWKLLTGQRGDSISFSNKTQYFEAARINRDRPGSLAAGNRSVCMRYPDSRRVWIIELPSARTRYGAQLGQHFAEATRNIPKSDQMRPMLEWFAETGVIDVNYDGLDDYPSLGIYSYRGAYFPLRRSSDREQELEEFGKLIFEGNGLTCEMDPPDAIYLVADGPYVYLNRKCNLTQLLSKEK